MSLASQGAQLGSVVRAACFWSALSLAACQCFTPVAEGGDAGASGGGTAGGASSGGGSAGGTVATAGGTSGVRCAQASDCTGLAPGGRTAFCGTLPTQGWSCAFGRCVYECLGSGRLCDSSTRSCLTCGAQTTCTSASCPLLTHVSFEGSSCGIPRDELWRTAPTMNPCESQLLFPDGGVAGTVWAYGYTALRAEIPSLGGPCIGADLQTGAVRFSLACPSCTAQIRPEIIGP